MKYFSIKNITPRIVQISSVFGVCSYLVLGDEKAIVIDTGLGVGSLRKVIEDLVKTPYEIVLTHAHMDHAGGVGEFDCPIHLHQRDIALYPEHCADIKRKTVLDVTNVFPKPPYFSWDDYIAYQPKEFIPIVEGQQFALGGIDFYCFEMPGHTFGSMVMYFPNEEILLSGDALGENTLLIFEESASVEEHYQAITKLKEKQLPIRTVLQQHGTYVALPDVVENNWQLAQAILAGSDDKVPTNTYGIDCFKGKDKNKYLKTDSKREGNIYYVTHNVTNKHL